MTELSYQAIPLCLALIWGLMVAQEDMQKKIEKWQEPPPAKQVRVLPAPDAEIKKRRGGRRARKYKERYGLTDTKKARAPAPHPMAGTLDRARTITRTATALLPPRRGASLPQTHGGSPEYHARNGKERYGLID